MDLCEFQTSLICRVSSRTVRTTQYDLVSRRKVTTDDHDSEEDRTQGTQPLTLQHNVFYKVHTQKVCNSYQKILQKQQKTNPSSHYGISTEIPQEVKIRTSIEPSYIPFRYKFKTASYP